MAAFGGPAVITNVLSGGDIIQIAALLPYFTQSLMVRADIRDLRSLQGKKIGITRFGSVTDFALRTLVERNNLKDVSTLQMGGFPEAVAALIRGAIDGAVLSPPHNFRLLKEGYRELVSPKDLRALGSGFLSQGIVAQKILRGNAPRFGCAPDQSHRGSDEIRQRQRRLHQTADRQISRHHRRGVLRQSYSYVTENFVKDPSVPENILQSMVQRMAQLNMIDAKAAQSTPTSAYYDNSFVNELKQSGFLASVWK